MEFLSNLNQKKKAKTLEDELLRCQRHYCVAEAYSSCVMLLCCTALLTPVTATSLPQ